RGNHGLETAGVKNGCLDSQQHRFLSASRRQSPVENQIVSRIRDEAARVAGPGDICGSARCDVNTLPNQLDSHYRIWHPACDKNCPPARRDDGLPAKTQEPRLAATDIKNVNRRQFFPASRVVTASEILDGHARVRDILSLNKANECEPIAVRKP